MNLNLIEIFSKITHRLVFNITILNILRKLILHEVNVCDDKNWPGSTKKTRPFMKSEEFIKPL